MNINFNEAIRSCEIQTGSNVPTDDQCLFYEIGLATQMFNTSSEISEVAKRDCKKIFNIYSHHFEPFCLPIVDCSFTSQNKMNKFVKRAFDN